MNIVSVRRHRWLRYALPGLIGLLVQGGLAAAEEAPLQSVSIRLNWFPAGYSAPFYVGVSKGWYREAGLDVTVQEGQGAGLTAQQVAAGRSTFGFISGDALLRADAQGAPLTMVASLAQTSGYCVLVKANSGITSAKDLEGKRYGAGPASAVASLFPAYMTAANASIDKVQRVAIDVSNLYASFVLGQFEGMEAVEFDTLPRIEARTGKLRCLPYADAGVRVMGLGLVTTQSVLTQKPDMVRKFVATTLRAFQFAYEHPDEAVAIVTKMGGDSVPNAAVSLAQLQAFEKLQTRPLGVMAAKDWQDTVAVMKQVVDLKGLPDDPARYFTNDYLPK